LLDANNYEVLSFDCYGTLVDWESGIISGLRPVLRGHDVEATDDEILALHAQTEHKLQAASKRGGYVKYRDMLAEEVREAGRRWGFEPSPSEVEALPDSVRYWLPFPDTVNALRALKGRYRLAIISNIDDGLFALTARYLEVEFDYIVTAEQAGTTSPRRTTSSWPLIGSVLPLGSCCTLRRASSTTTSRPSGWGWTAFGSTGGPPRGASGLPLQRRPSPTSRYRTWSPWSTLWG
jgi:2-haloalkanoic acid dehalogenase type II